MNIARSSKVWARFRLILNNFNLILAGRGHSIAHLTKTASVLHRRTFKALLDDDNSYLYIKGPQTLELAAHAF